MKIIVINIEAFHYIQTFRDNEIWKELFLPTEIENMFNGFTTVLPEFSSSTLTVLPTS